MLTSQFKFATGRSWFRLLGFVLFIIVSLRVSKYDADNFKIFKT